MVDIARPPTAVTEPPAVRASASPARRWRPSAATVRRTLAAVLPPVLLSAALLLLWEWYVNAADVQPKVLPAPSRVVEQGWQFRDLIWTHTVPTLQATVFGFVLAAVVAFAFAVVIDFSMPLRRAIYPMLVVSQTIPIVAIAPLMIIWFGFGLTPKVLLVALLTFFPMTVSWIEGFSSSEREMANLMRSMGANRLKVFRYVRLPSALPYFFAGLRIAITYAVVGAVFAEYVGAKYGLGIFMSMQRNSFRTDLVLAAVVVTSALTLALFAVTFLIQRIAIPWYALSRRYETAGSER
jgi:ABC-type nitrate/sulfonate/bicarbonate transport system permease component